MDQPYPDARARHRISHVWRPISLLAVGALLATACSSGAPPASPTSAAPAGAASPAASAAAAAPVSASPSLAPSASPSPYVVAALASPVASSSGGATQVSQQAYDALVAAAKQEGSVVIDGPPTPAMRDDLPQAFKQQFGIDMTYNGLQPGDFVNRITGERAAGIYSTDAVLSGSDTMYGVVANNGQVDNGAMGWLAPLAPALVDPNVVDPSKWRAGRLWWEDPQNEYVLRVANFVNNNLTINTSVIKPGQITSYHDLLDPQYTGKIVAYDPTINGSGLADASYFYVNFGSAFVQQLYVQQATLSRDNNQEGNMLADGSHPIAVSLQEQEVQSLQQQGLPVQYLTGMSDSPGYIAGGFGLVGLMDHAPHPNAAKLFMNWIAGPDGCKAYQEYNQQLCGRNDVGTDPIPATQVPAPGVSYFDVYEWNYVTGTRKSVEIDLRNILGRQ